jgi:hypothetical protein
LSKSHSGSNKASYTRCYNIDFKNFVSEREREK